MSTTQRDDRGRFTAGCKPGPGRPKKTAIPGDVIAKLAQPMSAFDLLELRSDLTAVLHEAQIAGFGETKLDQLVEVHTSNRHLAAAVLNKRLQAELKAESSSAVA